MHSLEQHTVRIAMHDPLHRRMRQVPDRIGPLLRRRHQFLRRGHILAGDWVIRIVRIDQRQHCRGDGDGIFLGDGVEATFLFHQSSLYETANSLESTHRATPPFTCPALACPTLAPPPLVTLGLDPRALHLSKGRKAQAHGVEPKGDD